MKSKHENAYSMKQTEENKNIKFRIQLIMYYLRDTILQNLIKFAFLQVKNPANQLAQRFLKFGFHFQNFSKLFSIVYIFVIQIYLFHSI